MKQNNQKTTNLVLLCEKVHDATNARYYSNYYLCINDTNEDGKTTTVQVPIKVNAPTYKAIRYLTRVLDTHSTIVTREYEKK